MPTSVSNPASLLNDRVHLRLFTAARVGIEPHQWYARTLMDRFWRFYFNDSLGARIESSGETIPLLPKTAYFIPSGVAFNGQNDASVTHFYIHFDVLGLSEGVRRELFAHPFAAPGSPAFKSLAVRTAAGFNIDTLNGDVDFPAQIDLKALIYTALSGYIRGVPKERQQRASQLQQAYAPLEPAINYIETHLAESLAIPELAALCHLSDDYFIRRFRQSMGRSPGAYIQEKRVTLAAQQLLFSDESIEVIATNCGFGNRFYLSRVFKAHTGISPAAYRGAPRL